MRLVSLPAIGAVAAWRAEVRALAAQGVAPEAVLWQVGQGADDLFAGTAPAVAPATQIRLPKQAVEGIETALHHSDPERFARAHALVLRLSRGELRWADRSDPAMARLLQQEKAVRRDIHKMHAFVRFREVTPPGAPRRAFAAWFEPTHPVVEPAAPFFARRFGDMDWVIATPALTARFEAGALAFEETRDTAPPPEDAAEDLWRVYFANIFNPARLMVSAMQSEMPKKFWKNLPEAGLIPDLIRTAPARAAAMRAALPTEPPRRASVVRERLPKWEVPMEVTLDTLKPALDACTRCPLGACATQGVPGEGPRDAPLMVVGEQPGDQEDLAGRPFVGPAGQLFDRAAAEAGLDRAQAWVTNAVKHFKFEPRGKRRIHQRPNAGEVQACRWWLDIERERLKPRLIVAMGATAMQSLTGRGEGVMKRRGGIEAMEDGTPVLITTHPSHILRIPSAEAKAKGFDALVQDLRKAAGIIGR